MPTQGSQLGTLVRFLSYMQEHGVDGVMGYNESLIKHMYGPDILHLVDDQALVNAGDELYRCVSDCPKLDLAIH